MKKTIALLALGFLLAGCGTGGGMYDTRAKDPALAKQLDALPKVYPVFPEGDIAPKAGSDFVVNIDDQLKPEVQGTLIFLGEPKGILTWYMNTLKTTGWTVDFWTNSADAKMNQEILPGDDPDSTWQEDATAQVVATISKEKRTLQLLLRKVKEPLGVEVDYLGIHAK